MRASHEANYPMPFSNKLHQSLTKTLLYILTLPAIIYSSILPIVIVAESSDPTIEIRNILGNKMPLQLERINRTTYRISLANYPVGYYLLVLQCDQCGTSHNRHEEIHKFLKQ